MLNNIIQLSLAVLAFLCALAGVIAHGFVTQSIHGLGWLLAAAFLLGTGLLVRISFAELRQQLKNRQP